MSVHEPLRAGAALAAFEQAELARFARVYPDEPGRFAHALAHHPLLSLDALAQAASRMDPRHVEVRAAANRNGGDFAFAPPPAGDAADTIRAIGTAQRWVMLRFIEQLPEYRELLDDLLAEITPVISARTGPPVRLQGFIFVSSPDTLTPFHFDPEYNVLIQVAGRKYFTVYPPAPPWLTPDRHERLHRDGDNMLPWRAENVFEGTANVLDAGDALYVPFKAPHWVRVGEGPSVSLSLTWCSRDSLMQDDAWRFNGWWRRRGHAPNEPALGARSTLVKALGWRILARTRRARPGGAQ